MVCFYMTEPGQDKPVTAEWLLRSIGASRRLSGFDYSEYMIEQVAYHNSSVHLITKRLYPETAKHFGVKTHSVEHALRTLINVCWENGNPETIQEITCGNVSDVPSNSEFIDMLAAYLIHIS